MRRAARILAAIGAAAVALAAIPAFAANGGPFGITTPDGTVNFGGPLGPFFLWIASWQSMFYRDLTAALGSLKENPLGVWLLLALSFGYGVFHAVGPGHGKAVISSYLISSGESARRGVLISFAAAMVQAAVAVLIVAGGALVLRVTAMQITNATDWLEAGSYALIAIVGAWLFWSKSFGGGHHHHHHHFLPGEVHGHDAHAHHGHGHEHHDHAHDAHGHEHHDHGAHDHDRADHDHAHHDHGHAHASDDDHATQLAPSAGSALWRAWSAILAVGIRPCSGAIIVLVFALSQGLFAAGIAAAIVMGLGTGLTVAILAAVAVGARGVAVRLAGTNSAFGVGAVRGLEIVAAGVVMLFGLIMLGGAIAGGLPT
jgi:ABC-type nickel/cobalt efflux system permease component RcnA